MEARRIVSRSLQQGRKKSILILITNSFAAINIIHSGLIKKLAQKYDVHLLSTMIRFQEIAQINNHFGIDLTLVLLDIPREPAWLTCLRRVEKALFAEHFDIATQKIKYQRRSGWLWMRIVLWLIGNKSLNRSILRMIRHAIIFLTSFASKLKPLLLSDFYGVISSSPLDSRENGIVNFLRRHRIKSLAMVISWDNLTSKGTMNADHDYTLVWNDFMKKEFLRFYSIFKPAKPKVVAVGIPRFDCYFDNRFKKPNIKARKQFNASLENRIILIATSALRHFPNQLDVIADILRFAKAEGNVHVLIRCHPADEVELYSQLSGEDIVTIWRPKNLPGAGSDRFYNWFPELDFLDSLSRMLQICDVCIQFASTMKLDAAACGKHVISIAYDGDNRIHHRHSVKRLYNYDHQVPLNALRIDQFVTSREQLYTALKVSLCTPKSHNQLSAIQSFTHFTEPKSVDFTFNTISKWLD